MHKLIYLLLFSLILFTSCIGQDRTSLQNDKNTESKTIGTKHEKLIKTQLTKNGPAENVHCGLLDKTGNLWFGKTGHGVFKYDGQSFTNFTVIDGLNSNSVSSVIEDNKGNILFGTGKGVALYDGKYFINFTENEDFGENAICSLLEDKEGRIWIGTCDKGTYFYDGKSFTHLTSKDSVVNDDSLTLSSLNGMTEDKTGNLWFASWAPACEGVSSYDGQTITKFTAKQGISDSLIHCVIEDKSGILWFGSRDHGVLRYDGNSFTHISDNNGPGNACIYSILEDKNGNIWFTTERNGVYRYDGKSFKNYTTEDGLINNSVFSVTEDKAGNLWFGTRNVGLCRFDGESFVNFSE